MKYFGGKCNNKTKMNSKEHKTNMEKNDKKKRK